MAIYKYIYIYVSLPVKSCTAQIQLGLPGGLDPVSLKARFCGGCWGSSAGPSDFPERPNVKNWDDFKLNRDHLICLSVK